MTYIEFAPPWPGRHCLQFSEAGGRPGHRHHHRGGPRGRGYAGGPVFGGRPGRRRRGDVRLAILRLLSEEPRNGYQLMQAIEERTAGRWSPSPGAVYPALAQLEDEGLIRSLQSEDGKVFELTETGTEQAQSLADRPAPWEQPEGPAQDALHELHALARQVVMAVRQVAHAGDESQIEGARALLADTRRALYRILAGDDIGEGSGDTAGEGVPGEAGEDTDAA